VLTFGNFVGICNRCEGEYGRNCKLWCTTAERYKHGRPQDGYYSLNRAFIEPYLTRMRGMAFIECSEVETRLKKELQSVGLLQPEQNAAPKSEMPHTNARNRERCEKRANGQRRKKSGAAAKGAAAKPSKITPPKKEIDTMSSPAAVGKRGKDVKAKVPARKSGREANGEESVKGGGKHLTTSLKKKGKSPAKSLVR